MKFGFCSANLFGNRRQAKPYPELAKKKKKKKTQYDTNIIEPAHEIMVLIT